MDVFTKFIRIYPVQTTSTKDAIDKVQFRQSVFGNPCRIIADKDAAFMPNDFKTYREQENIEHITITNGVSRGNGHAEQVHGTLIPVKIKLSLEDPLK